MTTADIVNSINTIEKDCKIQSSMRQDDPQLDYVKFYERIKGLQTILDESRPKSSGIVTG